VLAIFLRNKIKELPCKYQTENLALEEKELNLTFNGKNLIHTKLKILSLKKLARERLDKKDKSLRWPSKGGKELIIDNAYEFIGS